MWQTFFRCQRNPVLRSQLLSALMSGTTIEVERLPTASLLDAVLLATASRVYCEAEIVDDYAALLRRADEEWKQPGHTSNVFDQTHAATCDFLVTGRTSEIRCAEEQYIVDMVAWYLQQEPPNYFSKEIDDVRQHRLSKQDRIA